MKKPLLVSIAVIGCAVASYALIDRPELLREKWGGWTIEKSLNQHAQITSHYVLNNAGIGSPLVKILASDRFPWDGIGLSPLPGDVKEHLVLFLWFDYNRKANAGFIRWIYHSGEEETMILMPGTFGAAPDFVDLFWGLEIKENGREKKLGGFDYGFKNVGDEFQRVRVDIEWDATELDWGHTTTHRDIVRPGDTHRIYPKPESQNFGRALRLSERLEDK